MASIHRSEFFLLCYWIISTQAKQVPVSKFLFLFRVTFCFCTIHTQKKNNNNNNSNNKFKTKTTKMHLQYSNLAQDCKTNVISALPVNLIASYVIANATLKKIGL